MSEAVPGLASSRRKALHAALSLALPFVLWHHALYKRGGAYLLLDLAVSGRAVAWAHVVAVGVGVAAGLRARAVPPWRAPLLLVAFALGCSAALVGAFFSFGSAAAFVPFVWVVAVGLGLLLGLLAVTSVRTLAAMQFPREAFLDLLRVEALGGALLVAVAYLLAASRLGPLRVGLLLALACALTAHLGLGLSAPRAVAARRARRAVAVVCHGLALMQFAVEPLTPVREVALAPDPVVLARSTLASRLVLASGRGAFQLYVDALLRTSTIDAARRREAAAHPAMLTAPSRRRALLIGGGDGGALREMLRYPDLESVDVVEPEANLLDLAAAQPALVHENGGALSSPRVHARQLDPVAFLAGEPGRYDVIIVDLLDPEGPRRSKWYTRHFYHSLAEHLTPAGVGAVAAASSPLAQRQAFWCVVATVEAAGLQALPYRASLPTMGPWGYVLFSRAPLAVPAATALPPGLAYLDAPTLASLFALAPDEQRVPVEVNLLHHQVLTRYRAPPAP